MEEVQSVQSLRESVRYTPGVWHAKSRVMHTVTYRICLEYGSQIYFGHCDQIPKSSPISSPGQVGYHFPRVQYNTPGDKFHGAPDRIMEPQTVSPGVW